MTRPKNSNLKRLREVRAEAGMAVRDARTEVEGLALSVAATEAALQDPNTADEDVDKLEERLGQHQIAFRRARDRFARLQRQVEIADNERRAYVRQNFDDLRDEIQPALDSARVRIETARENLLAADDAWKDALAERNALLRDQPDLLIMDREPPPAHGHEGLVSEARRIGRARPKVAVA